MSSTLGVEHVSHASDDKEGERERESGLALLHTTMIEISRSYCKSVGRLGEGFGVQTQSLVPEANT